MDFKCDKCSASFVNNRNLTRHVAESHSEESFQCKTCLKTFKSRRVRDEHASMVHSEKQYECETCGKKFNKRSNIIRHQLIHTRKQKYNCAVCKLEFETPHELKTHHTAEHSRKRKTPEETQIAEKRKKKEPSRMIEVDPVLFQAELVNEAELRPIFEQYWSVIRTKHKINR